MAPAMIVGVGETTYVRDSELADEELQADAIALALADAGLSKRDVDGLAIATMTIPDDSPLIAEHLGMELGWVLKADYGGAGGVGSLARARQAIEAGQVDVVVSVGGSNRNPARQHDAGLPPIDYSRRNWVAPLGYGGPNSFFGLVQRRHMYEYGTTIEQLGIIATTLRRHAQKNPNALMTDDMSIDDYVNSRLISDPIRLLDCVMPCSGAAAVVLASSEVAARCAKPPVHMGAYVESVNPEIGSSSPNRLTTGFVGKGERLFAATPRESLDFLQLYDDYPIAILMQLEDLGFVAKGDGGRFLETTDISAWGELPINTGGGQLSTGQAGSGGGYIGLVEAVRQLRGEGGERQVADASVGLVTGIGLLSYGKNLAITNAMILGKEAL